LPIIIRKKKKDLGASRPFELLCRGGSFPSPFSLPRSEEERKSVELQTNHGVSREI
jgi:hypothetical protein